MADQFHSINSHNTYYFILTSLPPDDYDTDTLSVSEVKYAEIRGKRHY
jgi:hypothetical protein